MAPFEPADEQLGSWRDLENKFARPGLLLGNGASIAVADSFGYSSIYEKAKDPELDNPLSPDDVEVFDALGTTDFEQVLNALAISRMVCRQAGHDDSALGERYERIRRALLDAVKSVHPTYEEVGPKVVQCFQQVLAEFSAIFTTNYDLLLYWSIVQPPMVDRFGDFFWNSIDDLDFSPTNTELWFGRIPIYYLHGGLFIHQLPEAKTVKARGTERPGEPWGTYTPLLYLDVSYRNSEFPLFVTEGDSGQKKQAIARSDYLSFAYQRFANFGGPLVVFGHRLGSQDEHLVEAIRSWIRTAGKFRRVALAISIHAQEPDEIIVEKNRIAKSLDGASITFFDAGTFPLAECSKSKSLGSH